jgi:hypothetical protein
MRYYLSVDLGRMNDRTAITITEAVHQFKEIPLFSRPENVGSNNILTEYHVKWIERSQAPYPQVCDRIQALLENPELKWETTTLVDITGVGRAVGDELRKRGIAHIAISITGGMQIVTTPDGYNVPKRELAAALQIVFQSQRIKFADFGDMPGQPIPTNREIKEELQNFTIKINKRGHDQYEAEPGQHDDIVLSLSQAVWYAERYPIQSALNIKPLEYSGYDPFEKE